MPTYGSTTQTSIRLRKAPVLTDYQISSIERELREFDMFDLWLQPDLGNVQQLGRSLQVMDRTGSWIAEATDAGIVIGSAFTGPLPTIDIPADAASSANEMPLHVPGYFLPNSYTVIIVGEMRSFPIAQPAQFFNAGVAGGGDVEAYLVNNAVAMRHGDLQSQTTGSQFTTSGSNYNAQKFCAWFSYDADLADGAYGKNSAVATSWNPAVDALGPNLSGEQRPLVIGGKFNPAGSAGEQLMGIKLHSVFASRESWIKPGDTALRTRFLDLIRQRHGADITWS